MPGAIDCRDRLLFVALHGEGILVHDLARERTVLRLEPPEGTGPIEGLAVDGGYLLHLADPANQVVRAVTIFGREVRRFGRPGEGADRRGFLDSPRDCALDAEGSLFVACGRTPLVHAVQKFAPDGRCVGTLRSFGEANERFSAPRGLAAGRERLYVTDTNAGCVQVFTTAGVFVSMFSTASEVSERSFPTAIALRPGGGGCLVAQGGAEPCVKSFDGAGDFERIVIGPGSGEGTVDDPEDLVFDEAGRIYLLDLAGARVQRFDPEGRFDGIVVAGERLPA